MSCAQGPEKRKWGQVNQRRLSPNDPLKSRPRSAVLLHHGMIENDTTERSISSVGAFDFSASSDDEVQSLVGGTQDSPLPLEFRTSPPEGAHRPTRSLSPPPKFFLADREDMSSPAAAMLSSEQQPTALSVANGNNIASPRKRHRHRHHIQRPCLDFEKMQQVSSFFSPKNDLLLHHIWVVLFYMTSANDTPERKSRSLF